MAVPKIIADFETQLATAIAVSGTSFSLSSATDDDGVSLPAGLYYFTVDNGSSSKEYLAGTLSGTDVTGVVSVSRQGAETSGAVRAHRVGASVIMTDFATYKKYIDEVSIAGGANASLTLQGLVELPTTAQVNAGTALGETGAALAVTPDALLASNYGLNSPSASQKLFLNATTGQVIMLAYSSTPSGFLPCDGAAVSRATYAALFSAIGTTFGVGDNSTTFNVPNFNGRVPVGYSSGAPTKVFTFASRSSDTITVTSDVLTNSTTNELQTGQPVLYHTSGTDITGLTNDTTYYLIRVAYNQFKLATSVTNANAGTAITLSGDGTGTRTFTVTYTARALGSMGGTEIQANVPIHTHTTDAEYEAGGSGSGGTGGGVLTPATNQPAGETAPSNMPLFGVLNFVIKT